MSTLNDSAIVTEGDIVHLISQNFLIYNSDRGSSAALTAGSGYCFTYADYKYWVQTSVTLADHPNNKLVTYGVVKSTRFNPSNNGPGGPGTGFS